MYEKYNERMKLMVEKFKGEEMYVEKFNVLLCSASCMAVFACFVFKTATHQS